MRQIESFGVIIDFAHVKRHYLLNGVCWLASLTLIAVAAYVNFKRTHKPLESWRDELILLLHYCSYYFQNGVYLFVVKE